MALMRMGRGGPVRPQAPSGGNALGLMQNMASTVRDNATSLGAIPQQSLVAQPQANFGMAQAEGNFGAQVAAQATAVAPPVQSPFAPQQAAFANKISAPVPSLPAQAAPQALQARQQLGQFSDAQQFARGRFVR